MTIYNLSKKDRETIIACANFCECNSKAFYKLWSVNWLAWYRRFYRLKDKEGMKRNIEYFIQEIVYMPKGERV